MSDIFTYNSNHNQYQEIQSSTFYRESDLERTVETRLNEILTEYRVVKFKKDIYDPINDRVKRADIAIIKNDYSEWYIVEVELSGHRLSHVEEQIESFYNANYTESHADYLYNNNNSNFNLNELRRMVKSIDPSLLVIVDKNSPSWKEKLGVYGCSICLLQIYLDSQNCQAIRIKGEYPTTYTNFCFVKFKSGLASTVELLGRKGRDFCNTLGLDNGSIIDITYSGTKSKWKIFIDNNKHYLALVDGIMSLDTSIDRYLLTYNSDNNIYRFKKA